MSYPAALGKIEVKEGGELIEIPPEDVEELHVMLPTIMGGIAGATMKVNNTLGEYNNDIEKYDKCKIYIWREGGSATMILNGKLMVIGWEGSETQNDYYLIGSVEGYGYELIAPPELLLKEYEAEYGKNIIGDAIDLCPSLTLNTSEIADLTSQHDKEYDNATPFEVIRSILPVAKSSGANLGYDGYIDTSQIAQIFYNGKKTSSISLANRIVHYSKTDDVHRVRNIQTVYGKVGRNYPVDLVAWTNPTWPLTDGAWTATDGAVERSTSQKYIGPDASIRCYVAGSLYYGRVHFTLNEGKEIDCYHYGTFQNLELWLLPGKGVGTTFTIYLEDDSANEIWIREAIPKAESWNKITAPVGILNAQEWNYEDATFNWKKVKKFTFIYDLVGTGWRSPSWLPLPAATGGGSGEIFIDGLHFGKAKYIATSDQSSGSPYGARMAKPVTDDKLASNAECLKKAEQILDVLQNPVSSVKKIVVEGDYFKPSYMQPINVQDFNTSMRLLEIEHELIKTNWECKLVLGE